jgi:hypothetical protein
MDVSGERSAAQGVHSRTSEEGEFKGRIVETPSSRIPARSDLDISDAGSLAESRTTSSAQTPLASNTNPKKI